MHYSYIERIPSHTLYLNFAFWKSASVKPNMGHSNITTRFHIICYLDIFSSSFLTDPQVTNLDKLQAARVTGWCEYRVPIKMLPKAYIKKIGLYMLQYFCNHWSFCLCLLCAVNSVSTQGFNTGKGVFYKTVMTESIETINETIYYYCCSFSGGLWLEV